MRIHSASRLVCAAVYIVSVILNTSTISVVSASSLQITDLSADMEILKRQNTIQQKLIEKLTKEQEETKHLLGRAILALAAGTNSNLNDEKKVDSSHVIRKRSAPEEGNHSHDDVLSLHELLPLLITRCKDGRDGKDGVAGRDGINGINGINGKDGINGRDGRDGVNGRDGLPGSQGNNGETGSPGPQGPPGANGPPQNATNSQSGREGSPGTAGPPGSPGTPGLPGPHGAQGPVGIPGNSSLAGSVYTRWGRTSCESDAALLYQGFAAGPDFGKKGGGVNYQCLHLQPEFNSYSAGGAVSVISGAEYESQALGIFPDAAQNQNVPCARCYTQRSAVVMIPSRRSCPSGWTKEYEGYLMTEYDNYHPMTYECVDQNPEYLAGHSSNTNGALFYFVVPDCDGAGTIGHCPPYASNKQLTCVVCSK